MVYTIDIKNNNKTNENVINQQQKKKSFIQSQKDSFVDFLHQFFRIRVYITGIIAFIFLAGYNYLYTSVLKISSNNNENELKEQLKKNPILMILSITVLGPILEEFVFRKLLFGIINNYSKILAYLVSCILFGLSHLDFKNLLSYNEYISLPIYIVSGFILAFAYDFDGCLLASIIAHALNNGFDTICFFINNY